MLSIGVGALQIMLDKGKDLDWFESNTIITLTIVSAISLAYFGIWTYYQPFPVVDFSFFKNRNFAFGTAAVTIGYLFYFGSTVVTPLWLQTEQNYTPFWAGVAVAPVGIAPFFLSTTIGNNLYRFDLRALTALSFFIFALSFFYQANFTTDVSLDSDHADAVLARLWRSHLLFTSCAAVPGGKSYQDRYASASGLFNFIRILIGRDLELHYRLSYGPVLKSFIMPD